MKTSAPTVAPAEAGAPAPDSLGPLDERIGGVWPRSVAFWAGAFYLALFILRPWEQLLPALGDLHFERFYAMFMVAVVAMSRKSLVRFSSQSLTVLLFLAGVGLSGLCARDPSLAWAPFYDFMGLVIFYFIIMRIIRSPYDLLAMVTCYIGTMAVYLAKSLYEYKFHGHYRWTMGVTRLIGIEDTFGGPNNLAMSIVVSLPMLFFLWSARREFTAAWPLFWRRMLVLLLAGYLLLASASVILTNSRSGVLSFALFVAFAALRRRTFGARLGYCLGGVLLLLVLWRLAPEESKLRIETIWNPDAGPANAQASAEGRVEGLQAGLEMYRRFPLTGVGIGNFIPYRVNHIDGVSLNAHNLLGQVLGETGALGALGFFLMIAVTFLNIFRTRRLAQAEGGPRAAILAELAFASRNAMLLLFFEGLFGHNLLRYSWLWLAAFADLSHQLVAPRAAPVATPRAMEARPVHA